MVSLIPIPRLLRIIQLTTEHLKGINLLFIGEPWEISYIHNRRNTYNLNQQTLISFAEKCQL